MKCSSENPLFDVVVVMYASTLHQKQYFLFQCSLTGPQFKFFYDHVLLNGKWINNNK